MNNIYKAASIPYVDDFRYSVISNNKIIYNVGSKHEFHNLIINITTIKYTTKLMNVIYDLDLEQLRKDNIYGTNTYLIINGINIYLVEKIKREKSWTFFSKENEIKKLKKWKLINTK